MVVVHQPWCQLCKYKVLDLETLLDELWLCRKLLEIKVLELGLCNVGLAIFADPLQASRPFQTTCRQ